MDIYRSKGIVMFLLLCVLWFGHSVSAADSGNRDWLKIHYSDNGLNRILPLLKSEIDSISFEEWISEGDSVSSACIRVAMVGETISLSADSVMSMVLGSNIPTLYIDTDSLVKEIPSKEEYLTAALRYIPYGDGTDTLCSEVLIKGRGNSSWGFPKKPYRLKFDKKQSLAGLPKAKSFVLISNYIDNTLMRNAVAFKIARMLGLPYSNDVVPVNLVFNGTHRGCYILTNKVGINSGSVDIDEGRGILWEIDVSYDEPYRFHSETFDLPCMVKDPDFLEISAGDEQRAQELWEFWKQDLEEALSAVSYGIWQEKIDPEQFAKYVLVNSIMHNGELSYPKSLYLYKEGPEERYKFGPVWDFDWAMGYDRDYDVGLIYEGNPGFNFFMKIFRDKSFLSIFKGVLEDFCANRLEELLEFIDVYAALVRDSAIRDSMLWPAEHNDPRELHERNASHFEENVDWMKRWLLDRLKVMRNSPNFLLF